jgi:uncharacterized SAM-binding protein YcdF (DUF218 family)
LRRISSVFRNGLFAAVIVFSLLAGTALYFAPRYFVYAERPVKSDAVVLFVGPNFAAREREAHRLVEEGYSQLIIVPAFRQIYARGQTDGPRPSGLYRSVSLDGLKTYPRYYENTHIEVLNAWDMMQAMGLKSAIMVSSPYHMRRISMISGKVFGESCRFMTYVPTRYERCPQGLREMDASYWMRIFGEAVKICWFHISFSLTV